MDAGMIEEGEALEKVLGRVPQRLHDSLRDTMARWCENLPPIEEVYHLAQELKEKGYRLYLLSNASTRFHEFKHTIPAIALMDGCLISADVKLAKPSPAVYQKLLELHNLKAEECYFIDDNPQNVEAARGEGFDGFVFTGDIDALRRDMARKGILEA